MANGETTRKEAKIMLRKKTAFPLQRQGFFVNRVDYGHGVQRCTRKNASCQVVQTGGKIIVEIGLHILGKMESDGFLSSSAVSAWITQYNPLGQPKLSTYYKESRMATNIWRFWWDMQYNRNNKKAVTLLMDKMTKSAELSLAGEVFLWASAKL